jgi:hypothetical protein
MPNHYSSPSYSGNQGNQGNQAGNQGNQGGNQDNLGMNNQNLQGGLQGAQVDINVRKKIFNISNITSVKYKQPISNVPNFTNSSISMISNLISTKPKLITKGELQNLGKDIKLVGYDPLAGLVSNSNKTFTSKLLNWVEPYEIKGIANHTNAFTQTLFYTEVNSELKVGDRVFIINGTYDSDLLIKINKYKKGRDGYKILYIEKCKVVLNIDYTGILPYSISADDEFIKVYYIRDKSEFLHANRSITTKNANVDNKFSYYQNNIAFIDNNYSTIQNWGLNDGISTSPGFYVRSSTASWTNITTDFINSGSYSYALSPTYSNVNRVKIMNADFTYNGREFKEGYIYKWVVGPTQSSWEVDVTYFKPYLTKNNFRDGNFRGEFNGGLYGQYDTRIKWHGDSSVWNIGALVNTIWKKGIMNSLYTASQSYFSSFDIYGLPYQKINSPNNAGRGYNFIDNSTIESSIITNGSFYKTTFGTQSIATYSIVENEILGIESPYLNKIKQAFFNDCEFNNSYLENSELKNTKSNNSKFEKSKSINSYFNNSVLKDSFYNSENIIKIVAYDELTASEFPAITTSTYSLTNDIVQKVYKFYINKNGYDRLRTGDKFYIKGLDINNQSKKDVINFFDKKFKIGSWTDYTEENFGVTNTGKKGYEYSAFLSTPLENSYRIKTATFSYLGIKYHTTIDGLNPNNYYSIDIWVSRYDKTGSFTTENLDFNYNTSTFTSSNNIINFSKAYIVDSDFDGGLIQNCDWNSGSHIESNNDNNITIQSLIGGSYNLSIDPSNYITATTSYDYDYPESNLINVGNVVFLDSVDFNDFGTGVVSRIPDAYKIISNTDGVYKLQEIGTYSQIISLSASNGYFYTKDAENRYGHLRKVKISKSNIKSGFLRRTYLSESLIQNLDYNYLDKDFVNLSKIKNLVISDSIFSNNSNILSNATYINSFFVEGNDKWNSGIIKNSIWNGGTFSNGVIRDSRWIKGNLLNAWFYNSRTFNGSSSVINPYYYSENINSYYREGTIPNNRNSWQDGNFISGYFYKSDWELGTFSNGVFYYSKWYDGLFKKGVIGSNEFSTSDTQLYNGTVSYALVENAALYSSDTSYYQNVNQNLIWQSGIFNDGIFGSNILQVASNSATWYKGEFNDGEFINNGKWKNGVFNGGKFTSGYGWTQSESTSELDYTWEEGVFNGGEFGNSNGSTNSTWYTGEFNGGIFSGRVWNDGVFSNGEFQGSGGNPVSGLTSGNANIFVDSYSQSYWGKWRDGILTDIKDKFIKNKKFFTKPVMAMILQNNIDTLKSVKFKNGLWMGGTFSHSTGEMNSSVWLNGVFEKGKFKNSSFNPYVKRNGLMTPSFNFNDNTCYWEDGDFEESDFYISHWKNGNFIIGTATGMIWENGVAQYMNAFNIFWENGIWRNGNWYGSSFEFEGQVIDDYNLQILNRGIYWSGTYSCHIWNIFLQNTDDEKTIISAAASSPSDLSTANGWISDSTGVPALPPVGFVPLGGGGGGSPP